MAQPYVGEIRMFGGNFAPAGWMFCEGQLLPISENETLFNLIGTTYGGDGQSTFALPDLRGRIPLHQGAGFVLAEQGGTETVTLVSSQLPAHAHALVGSTDAATDINAGAKAPAEPIKRMYSSASADTALDAQAVGQAGGGGPHENTQPFLCISFIISLFGIFPSQS